MPRFLILVVALSCVGFFEMAEAAFQQTGFLEIDGGAIKGNATVSGYEDQIVVQSVSYGVSQAGEWEEGSQLTGRVTQFGDMNITKVMDNGSPALAQACAMKRQFGKVELNLVAGTDAYLTVTLYKVIVTSVQVGYTAGDIRPTENLTLSYRKAVWRYGTATTSYNLEAATTFAPQIQQRRPAKRMPRPRIKVQPRKMR